jgi:lipid A 3-O-deacylase
MLNLRLTAAALLCAASLTAHAGNVFDEVRVGLMDHDSGLVDSHVENGVDLNMEVLLQSPDWMKWAYSPKPSIGTTTSLRDQTSLLHFGFSWELPISGPIFANANLGLGFNNGVTRNQVGRRNMGCNGDFYESLSVGGQFLEKHRLMATVEHASNAYICNSNAGLTNLGIRYGYKL